MAVELDLSGRVALVTGGSRGLGRAMVDGFARAGADVVIASRSLESCEKAAAEATAATGRAALPYGVHVGRWDWLDGLVGAAYDRFGRIDVPVNNAGMSPLHDSVDAVSEELFDKVIAVNLKGPFRLAVLVGVRMAASGGGSIINISSAGAVRPPRRHHPVCGSQGRPERRHGRAGTRARPSVRVNTILAGTFLTDVSKSWDAGAFAARTQRFALKRGGQPDEIVGAALYLASDASSYTTGAIVPVDGGQA